MPKPGEELDQEARVSSPGSTLELDPTVKAAAIWTGALLAVLLAWMWASPVGASPDEQAHLAYAWGLVSGQEVFDLPPDCDAAPVGCLIEVDVPVGLLPASSCHQFKPNVPASCLGPRTITVQQVATVRYPPPYYLAVGSVLRTSLAVGIGAETASLLGRLAGALISLSILVPALVVASRRIPKVLPFVIVCLTPMTLFMSVSVNPSGPEICGAIAVATALVQLASSTKMDRWTLFTFVYGVGWLSWSRPLGFLWACVLLGFGVLYVQLGRSSDLKSLKTTVREMRAALVPAVLLVGSSVAWFGYSLQVRSTGASAGRSVPEPGLERLVATPFRWGGILWESIGVLGWLDTTLPLPTIFAIIVGISGMVVLSSIDSEQGLRARRVVLAYLGSIVFGITVIMFRTDFLWQGRYALPSLAAGLIMWGGMSADRMSGPIRRLGMIAWVASASSVLWLAARYMYGLQRGSRYHVPNFSDDAQWLPAVGGPGFVALAFLGVLLMPLAIRLTTSDDQIEAPQD